MLFSLAWLRSLCPFDLEAPEIARILTARGLAVEAQQSGPRDTTFDIDIPANRPDCLGHLGVAREIGAALGVPLLAPAPEAARDPEPADRVHVTIDAPELCARYTARIVRGVRVGPSPDWLAERIEAVGLRPINNVVDLSNVVLLELGQPVHFFDADRIAGREIRIRRARAAERLRTLDGVERVLDPTMLVIADAERATALAGILGGADSQISAATRNVLVEAAWFAPASVRRTARALGIRTDASYRFERGMDLEGPAAAQHLAGRLLTEHAHGTALPWIDTYPAPRPRPVRVLRPERIGRLLGYTPGADRALGALAALGLSPLDRGKGGIEVTIPSWRVDLDREEDLVEEVARHIGYDAVPASLAGLPHPTPRASEENPEESARSILAGLGFHEAFGYAMIAESADSAFISQGGAAAPRLSNPIAEPLSCLRRSLLPGLLDAVDLNHRRGTTDVRLFEVGRVFEVSTPGERPVERRALGVAWSGAARPTHWSDPLREVGYADIAGVVERLLGGLRPGHSATAARGAPEAYHPGSAATWRLPDGTPVARAGSLRPERQRGFESPVWVCEVDLDTLCALPCAVERFRSLPRRSPVTRDLSLQVPRSRAFGEIAAALRTVPSPAPATFDVLDRYEGPPLPPGDISVTVRVTIAPDDRTLVDAEIEAYRLDLVRAIGAIDGVRVRGE